uniref:G-protein coupled receptors family 1 profile domain-containing protein n=2 Tax=Clytia hemisphaerica TaxID=252671 RepID=A0A7M5V6U4_9CNID
KFCQVQLQLLLDIKPDSKLFLVIYLTLLAFGGCVVNSLVVYFMTVTKQLANQSFRLIFYSSINDILASLITLYKIPMVVVPNHITCSYLVAERFLSPFTRFASTSLVCLIGIDCLCRVKYLQDYQTKFTSLRFHILLFIFSETIIYQSLIHFVFNAFYNNNKTSLYTHPVNSGVLTIFLVSYLASFKILNRHQRSTTVQRSNSLRSNRDIMKVSKSYFFLYLISYGFLFALYVARVWILADIMEQLIRGNLVLYIEVCASIYLINAIINGIVVLRINRPTKRRIRRLGTRLRSRISGSRPAADPADVSNNKM